MDIRSFYDGLYSYPEALKYKLIVVAHMILIFRLARESGFMNSVKIMS